MQLSIFTPTHAPGYLLEAFESFRHSKAWFEWVIVPNGECRLADIPFEIVRDPRVIIVQAPEELGSRIGGLKGFACSQCKGNVLVELDHDDLLVEPILNLVDHAFIQNPTASLVYSNFANVNSDWTCRQYNQFYGWKTRPWRYQDRDLEETLAPLPDAHTASSMFWGPNHIRAFRRTSYEAVGGYNQELWVGDDQDLECKLFCVGPFVHIDRCGYIYRVHGQNTWLKCIDEIQEFIKRTRAYYLRPMIEAEVRRKGGRLVDIGGRFGAPDGYEIVDRVAADGVDIVADLNCRYPFEDSSVDVIRACDFLEHVADKMHSLSEIHRVLKPGGYLISDTPSTCGPNGEAGQGADQDPTHVSRWNRNSFWYVTKRQQAKYIDNTTVRFFPMVLENYFVSDWHKQNFIPYVRSDLICMKDGVQPSHGGIEI